MIIMAVDIGTVRTGIAVSDAGERFAFPKAVITERNREKLIAALAAKAAEYGAGLLVVGYPKNMDASEGFKAKECAAAAEQLRAATGLETLLWDERCTTVLAHDALRSSGMRGKKHREVVDAVAAVMILENYLRYRQLHPAKDSDT